VIEGLRQARALGCRTLGFTGGDGGRLRECCDVCLVVPSTDAARIQEMHLLLGHTFCHACEQALCAASSPLHARPTIYVRDAA
jgi:D-sedoheptulose 7-phosphate isomerase